MRDVTQVAAPHTQSGQSKSVGSLIDELYELNQQKRELDAQLKGLKKEIELAEQAVFEQLDKQELTLCRGRIGKVSIMTSLVPTVHDWEKFQTYIIETGALHLLERRAALTAWREVHESGEEVPGVSPFKKRTLSIRKA